MPANGVVCTRITSGSRATSSFASTCARSALALRKAIVDADIAALRPSKPFEPMPERREARLVFRIVLGERHEHADPPHAVALLRPRRQRPRRRHAAEKGDELAPLHEWPP